MHSPRKGRAVHSTVAARICYWRCFFFPLILTRTLTPWPLKRSNQFPNRANYFARAHIFIPLFSFFLEGENWEISLQVCVSVTGVQQQSLVCLQGELYCLPLVLCQSGSFIVVPLSRIPLKALCCTAVMLTRVPGSISAAFRTGRPGGRSVRPPARGSMSKAPWRRAGGAPGFPTGWLKASGQDGLQRLMSLTASLVWHPLMPSFFLSCVGEEPQDNVADWWRSCAAAILMCNDAPEQAWWRQREISNSVWEKCKHF